MLTKEYPPVSSWEFKLSHDVWNISELLNVICKLQKFDKLSCIFVEDNTDVLYMCHKRKATKKVFLLSIIAARPAMWNY